MAGSSSSEESSSSSGGGSSSGQSSGSSYSYTYIPDYSETPILDEIAQHARAMSDVVYNKGVDIYNKNQGSIDGLMRDALSYASPQRISVDMGMAESGVQQAAERGRQSAIRDLESYGIDPSSGRYAALDQANRVMSAASAAGAGNQQRMADQAAGNAMRNQAISAGLQNAGYMSSVNKDANAFLATGMQLKYPPLGRISGSSNQSTQSSSNTSSSQGHKTSQSQSDDGGGGGGKGGQQPKQPQEGGQGGGGAGGGKGAGGGGAGKGPGQGTGGKDPEPGKGPGQQPPEEPKTEPPVEQGEPNPTPPVERGPDLPEPGEPNPAGTVDRGPDLPPPDPTIDESAGLDTSQRPDISDKPDLTDPANYPGVDPGDPFGTFKDDPNAPGDKGDSTTPMSSNDSPYNDQPIDTGYNAYGDNVQTAAFTQDAGVDPVTGEPITDQADTVNADPTGSLYTEGDFTGDPTGGDWLDMGGQEYSADQYDMGGADTLDYGGQGDFGGDFGGADTVDYGDTGGDFGADYGDWGDTGDTGDWGDWGDTGDYGDWGDTGDYGDGSDYGGDYGDESGDYGDGYDFGDEGDYGSDYGDESDYGDDSSWDDSGDYGDDSGWDDSGDDSGWDDSGDSGWDDSGDSGWDDSGDSGGSDDSGDSGGDGGGDDGGDYEAARGGFVRRGRMRRGRRRARVMPPRGPRPPRRMRRPMRRPMRPPMRTGYRPRPGFARGGRVPMAPEPQFNKGLRPPQAPRPARGAPMMAPGGPRPAPMAGRPMTPGNFISANGMPPPTVGAMPLPQRMARGGQAGRRAEPTQGGFVSRELSPSGGSRTDDVEARLNAGEFVIPKDVSAWKGKEFFYKLIQQARKNRATGGQPQAPQIGYGPNKGPMR